MKSLLLTILFCIANIIGWSQDEVKIFHITSSHTSFPDTGRSNGHLYNKVIYDALTHYNDSSVLIIVPRKFHFKKRPDLIFWFHGWGNHIDSAATRYDLINQFIKSNTAAILVLAETAKDAPDSYGGKLERSGEFNLLVNDILNKLMTEKIIPKPTVAGKVVLAGHSGAYRVMAYILQNGNVPVNEVILFDALYAETDKYLGWLKADDHHRFIDLYTDHGGTDGESKQMMNLLSNNNMRYNSLEETQLNQEVLQRNKILFIHSTHAHNDIIQSPDNFELFIEGFKDSEGPE